MMPIKPALEIFTCSCVSHHHPGFNRLLAGMVRMVVQCLILAGPITQGLVLALVVLRNTNKHEEQHQPAAAISPVQCRTYMYVQIWTGGSGVPSKNKSIALCSSSSYVNPSNSVHAVSACDTLLHGLAGAGNSPIARK
jgi:hypothetical protein